MIETIVWYINLFFLYYMFMYALIFCASALLSAFDLEKFIEKRKYISSIALNNKLNYIPISIIVPAFNEDVTVVDTIRSLLNLQYEEYEIIIVNDGSTDNTAKFLIEEFSLLHVYRPFRRVVECKDAQSIYESRIGNVTITLINKENGGKADALNMGINVSRYPLFISMDSDSMLEKDALLKIVEPFIESDETTAVGGSVRVSNGIVLKDGKIVSRGASKKLIVLFQMIEYIRVFISSRVAFNKFNINMIISGAFGLYRKSTVIAVGGYNASVIGEDMEMVVKLHTYALKNKISYNIKHIPDAVCWTQVPEKLGDLKKQRRRWHMGLMQSLWEHKYVFLNIKYGTISFISYLYYFLFELLSPLLEFIGLFAIIASFMLDIINMQFMILYFCLYIGYSIVTSAVAIMLDHHLYDKQNRKSYIIKLLLVSVLESFGYRQLISIYRISAFVNYRKNKSNWGKITRIQTKKEDEMQPI